MTDPDDDQRHMLEVKEEEVYNLDWKYINKKLIYFDHFLSYMKTIRHFDSNKEFKLAMVIQSTKDSPYKVHDSASSGNASLALSQTTNSVKIDQAFNFENFARRESQHKGSSKDQHDIQLITMHIREDQM